MTVALMGIATLFAFALGWIAGALMGNR